MEDLDEKLQALDDLLGQVSASPEVQKIRDRAQDSGHLDDDWITSLTTGAADEDELRAARRHVVFCDQCANLLLNRGGEATEGITSLGKKPGRKKESPLRRYTPSTIVKVSVVVAILVVLSLAFYRVLPRWLERESDGLRVAKVPADLVVSARGAEASEAGRLSLSRLAFVRLKGKESLNDQFVYVFLVDGKGDTIRLEPKSGVAEIRDRRVDLELPNDFGGYNLKALGDFSAGQLVAFFVLSHEERISLMEGDIFDRITKQRIKVEANKKFRDLDSSGFAQLAANLKTLGIPGKIEWLAVRLIP